MLYQACPKLPPNLTNLTIHIVLHTPFGPTNFNAPIYDQDASSWRALDTCLAQHRSLSQIKLELSIFWSGMVDLFQQKSPDFTHIPFIVALPSLFSNLWNESRFSFVLDVKKTE